MAKTVSLQIENDDLVDVEITNSDNQVVYTIRLDTSDKETPIRFADLLKNVEAISDEAEANEKVLKEKYGHIKDGEYDYNKVVDTSKSHIMALEKIMAEIDTVFGEDCIESVYAEHYEFNPDYVPDEYAIMDFLDKLIPLMNDTYGQRFESKNKKYNVNRRGKRHNLTKEEIIQRQMGK